MRSLQRWLLVAGIAASGGCQVLFSEPTFDGATSSSGSGTGGGTTATATTTSGTTSGVSTGASTSAGSTTSTSGGGGAGGAAPAVCGNSVVESGESCDDGNTTTGDGCGSTCLHVVKISEGSTGDHACVILANNRIKCWGANDHGQLGYENNANAGNAPGTMGDQLDLVDLGLNAANNPFSVSQVGVGGSMTCARFASGLVKCWGANFDGQLGAGDTLPHGLGVGTMGDALPLVNVGDTVEAITVGNGFACAIKTSNKRVVCWGANDSGQLAVGGTNPVGGTPFASLAEVPLGNYEAKQISAGDAHVCAVLDDAGTQRVKCWGANDHGQLGIDEAGSRGANPTEMGDSLPFVGVGAVVAVSAGGFFTCAHLVGGRVKCWGTNHEGALGLASATPATVGLTANSVEALAPIDLGHEGGGITLVTDVTAGQDFTCVLTKLGAVKCWGAGQFGELGTGTNADVGDSLGDMGDNLPEVQLGVVAPAVIRPHRTFTCALLANSTTKCWGFGLNGALGYEDMLHRGDGPNEMGVNLPAQELP